MKILFVLMIAFMTSAAIAQEAPPKSTPDKKVEAPKPPKMVPITISLSANQMICQPRTAECMKCSADDPCYLYQQAQQPERD